MVKDVEGQEDEAALEWGISYGLDDGEELPVDVEDLTEAQYTIFMMVKMLKGTFEGAGAKVVMGEKGSGLILPT